MKTLRFSILLIVASATNILACGDYSSLNSPRVLAHLAVSSDDAKAKHAIAKLRALGPEGLQTFLDVHASSLAGTSQPDPKLRSALESISGQRDGHASRLFWYTDLEQAKSAAQKLGRPILSLRLLGRLDEELSCANSRFFRTALYPNKEINEVLRNDFVLHWESVRPAPKITVDFGDGRRLERTITGNSIHYVLAPDGQPMEAIPGMYGPKAFLRQLETARQLTHQCITAEAGKRPTFLREYHATRLDTAVANWSADLARLAPVIDGAMTLRTREVLEKRMTPELWTAIARLHGADAVLDADSRRLMRAKNPNAVDAGRIAVTKAMVEDPLLRVMREFERSMTEDTVRNEYLLHTQIHEWFKHGDQDIIDVRRLNNRVYAQLFLMPGNDPWLGLRPPGAYSGVELDGASIASVILTP